jgi:hypoxanthine phosphoribosyltransferase
MGEEIKKIYLSWTDINDLISSMVPRLQGYDYEVLIAITRGGIIPGGVIAEQLAIPQVLVASVDFYEDESHQLDWPVFMQFPADSFLRGKSILIVDDIWDRGKEVLTVTDRVEQAGGRPMSAVLHYKPHRSLFKDKAPNFFAAQTEDWIIYPWEVDRKALGV